MALGTVAHIPSANTDDVVVTTSGYVPMSAQPAGTALSEGPARAYKRVFGPHRAPSARLSAAGQQGFAAAPAALDGQIESQAAPGNSPGAACPVAADEIRSVRSR
jgi:hypothetical protein